MPGPTGARFIERLERAQGRLAALAASPAAPGLTEPDRPSGERWDWGQVWAHLAEFVPYWIGELRLILGRPASEDPVPFGRTKADPVRIAAIEADRHRPPPELMAKLEEQLDELKAFTRSLGEGDWERQGLHSTLGVMDLPRVFEEFLVRHLEAHAEQLDGLVAGREPPKSVSTRRPGAR